MPQMQHHEADVSPLRKVRQARGLTQEALGVAAGGVSRATIIRIEAGVVQPYRSTLSALARALGCRVQDIRPAIERRS